MKFFNLKRMTVLLSIVLAFTPVLSVQAASPVSGGAVFQNLSSQDDINVVISAAGIPSGTLATTLQYAFNVSATNYRHSTTNKTAAAIPTLFSNYVSAAQAGSQSGATVAAVNSAMQSLMTLMGAIIPDYNDQNVIAVLKGLILPLTKAQLSQSAAPAGVGDDQYLVNIFVNELAAWVPLQQNASGTQNSNANTAMLLAAAQQLGLIPATAAAMQNLINVAGCNTQPTIQKQINCAIAFYNNWLTTTNQAIGQLVTVTTDLNNLVATATTTINNDASSYTSQINAATSTAAVTTLFNAGIAAINAVYPPLIGANGTIEAQNTLATDLEATLKAAVAAIGNVQSTQINATTASLSKAESNFTTSIDQADQAFPQSLPVGGLTVATAANFATSVPGDAINSLNGAQGAITQPVQTVTANTTALTNALNAITAAMTSDQNTAISNIDAAKNTTDTQTALNNGIAAVNTDYANLTAAGSAYLTALNDAKTTLADLTALQTSHAQISDIGTALTTLTNAINSATSSAPILASGAQFTAANAASTYQNTLPGIAILAMVAEQTKINNKNSSSGGLSAGDIGGIIGGILGLFAVIGGVAILKNWLESQAGQKAIQDEANEQAETESALNQLSDSLKSQLKKAVDNNDNSALDNLVSENPDLQSYAEGLVKRAYTSDTNISTQNDGALDNLINSNLSGKTDWNSFKEAFEAANTQLTSLQDKGFTPDDLLTMAQNDDLFKDVTDIGKNISNLSDVINSNNINKKPGVDINNTSLVNEVEEALQATNIPGGQTGGNTGEGPSTGTGSDISAPTAGETEQQLEATIEENIDSLHNESDEDLENLEDTLKADAVDVAAAEKANASDANQLEQQLEQQEAKINEEVTERNEAGDNTIEPLDL